MSGDSSLEVTGTSWIDHHHRLLVPDCSIRTYRAVCVPKSTDVVASLPTPFATVCQSLPFSETLTAKEPPEVIRASFTVITGQVRVPDEWFGLHNGIQLAYAPRPSIFDWPSIRTTSAASDTDGTVTILTKPTTSVQLIACSDSLSLTYTCVSLLPESLVNSTPVAPIRR